MSALECLVASAKGTAQDNMHSLRLPGLEEFAQGVTTLDEVLRPAPPFET